MATHHHRTEIDREDRVPVGGFGAHDRAEGGGSRRRDEGVDAPELGDGLLDHRLDGRILRDVGGDGERRSSALANRRRSRGQLLPRARREHHRGALAGQGHGDGVTDSTPGAGDDRDLALERARPVQI